MPKKKQSYKDMMAEILKPKDKPASKTNIQGLGGGAPAKVIKI